MPAPNHSGSHLRAAPPAPPWRDSPLRFGRISRLLHWAMALLLAWQFVGMALKLAFDLSPRDSWLVGTHNHVGMVLWLLAVIAGHIAMVLVHHFIWRDDTARRMLGRRGPSIRG